MRSLWHARILRYLRNWASSSHLSKKDLGLEKMSEGFKTVMLDSVLYLTDIERDRMSDIGSSIEQYDIYEPEDILKVAKDADAIMTVSAHVTREVIEQLERCRVIARYGCGFDNVDTKAATEKGIVVTYVPVYCQKDVATMAVSLLLACERRLFKADAATKRGDWVSCSQLVEGARSIDGKTVGLVGFGRIAQAAAPMLQAFGANIITYDPAVNKELAAKMNVTSVDFDTLISTSDAISIHCPKTAETIHMIGRPQFEKMKKGVIIVNTGRGAVIDQAELAKAIKEGIVGGAGLDVLDPEPPELEDELYSLDNVICSGHTAACTIESVDRLRRAVAENVANVLTGKMPLECANPEVLEKLDLK